MHSKFGSLTKFIDKIDATESFGEWVIDKENDGTPERPIHMPWVDYNSMVDGFVRDFYQFSKAHPEYELSRYNEILVENNIEWGAEVMSSAVTDSLNEQCILAMIMGVIRADRFCEGALLSFFKDGCISKWLKRLKDIDLAG